MRILATMIFLLLMPFSSLAISLVEIQYSPNQYVEIGDSAVKALYVDINSIQSVRCSPPYYTIQVTGYYIDYKVNAVVQSRDVFNYDYNKSMESLIKEKQRLYPSKSKKEATGVAIEEIKKDSGIIWSSLDRKVYSFDGTYLGKGDDALGKKVLAFSDRYYEAKYIFMKHYNLG